MGQLSPILRLDGSSKLRGEAEICELVVEILRVKIGKNISLDKIETEVSELFKNLRKSVTEELIESADAVEMNCPKCGQKMKIIDRRSRTIKGLVDYKFCRRNFYCSDCNIYEKPLYGVINCSSNFSLELKEAMVLLGQRVPFEEACFFIKKLLKVEVSHKSVQEYTEKVGCKIGLDEEVRVKELINYDGYVKTEIQSEALKNGTAYMELDGSMVQTREEGWKEVRNGILFVDKDRAAVDKHHKELLSKKYFSIFNPGDNFLESFNNRATQAAYDFGFHNYEKRVILGDGAVSIWNYASMYHPDAIQILDYYHASEYLGKALISLESSNNKIREEKFKLLEEGEIKKIIDWLQEQKQTPEVISCSRYFSKNIDRMAYGHYKRMGLDIGSGTIESAHRILIQVRMKQSGMHWGKKNIQSIASLRAKYLSGEWEQVVASYLKAA